jgi:hypothetical protein
VIFFLGLSSSSAAIASSLGIWHFPPSDDMLQVHGDPAVIFARAQFQTRMPRPDRMRFDRMG